MKKYYVAPNMKVMNVKLQSLLTVVSGEGLGWGGEGSGKSAESRNRGLWDDEDDF